jgi:hemerythrin-like metal-binding protein
MFNWTEEMTIGVPEIDRDHQNLFKMLNEIKSVTGIDEQAIYLNRFIEYATSHFRSEENLMKYHQYSLYKEHHIEHEKITKRLAEIFEKQMRGGAEAIAHEDLVKLIQFWFFEHTLKMDTKLRELVNH